MQKWQRWPLLQQYQQEETTLMKKLLIRRNNSQIFKIFLSKLDVNTSYYRWLGISASSAMYSIILYLFLLRLPVFNSIYCCISQYLTLEFQDWGGTRVGCSICPSLVVGHIVVSSYGFSSVHTEVSGRQENQSCLFLLKQHQFCAIKAPLLVVPLTLIISLKSHFQLFSHLW